MMDKPIVSIVIPALNEEVHIRRCLESIFVLEGGIPFEVIVVDNGSIDETREISKLFGAIVLCLPDVSIAALRNAGARKAKGEFLAFVDADCTIDKFWFTFALKRFDDKNVAVVGSAHRIPAGSSWVAKAWGINNEVRQTHRSVTYVPSGNCFIRKRHFDEIGGFDEELLVSEDTNICFNLKTKGYTIVADSEVKAYHWGAPQTLSTFFKKEIWHGTDALRLFVSPGFRKSYFRVVAYAFYYDIIIIGVLVTLLMREWKALVFLAGMGIVIPFVLASIITMPKRKYVYFLPLSTLYFLYGIARGISIFGYRNRQIKSIS